MDRETLDSLDKETLIRLILSQAEAIERLMREVQALRADNAELRAKLNLPPKTPENSSTPPSQGHKASGEESKTPVGKRRKPHAGAHRPLHPNPAAKRDVFASSCQHCGAFFLDTPQFVCEAYDHIEIPRIIPHVTRVSLLGGACLCCARTFKAPPPQDMPKGSPFGPNLRALVIYLRFTQGIAFERLSTLLSDLLGLDISEGALVNILDAARVSFTAATAAIRARLLGGTILQSDETGLRVGKQNWWLWVFHHDDSALFVAAPSRAKNVVEDFLGDFRPDFWVSDRYGGQMGWAAVNNQVCLAHLIRDVQYAIDAGDDIFAPELRRLLGRACRIGRNHLARKAVICFEAPPDKGGVAEQIIATQNGLLDEPNALRSDRLISANRFAIRSVSAITQWFFLRRDTGRQLALWGDSVISDRVARAAIRVQAMLGHEAVTRPVLAGGRVPAEQVLLVPFGDAGAAAAARGPAVARADPGARACHRLPGAASGRGDR